MSFSATHVNKTAKRWIRDEEHGAERKDLRVKKPEDFHNDRTKGHKAKSREPSQSTSSIPASVAPLLSPAVHARSATSASAAPSHLQRTTYSRPVPGDITYSQHAVRPVSGAQTQGPTRLNLTTPSHTRSVAHSTHSTYPASMINDAKSYMSTSSAVQNTVPPVRHSHPPQDVPSPSQNSNGSRTPSVASVAPSTASGRHLAVLPSRDSSRALSAVGATPSKVSETYPSLPPSRDSSCAPPSRVPESTTPASESRLLTYRAPSVVTVTSSTISDQHPLSHASTASSVIHSLQPSRAPSVASATRNTVSEDRRVLPTPESSSPSIAPSGVSVKKESPEYLQESHTRDLSRAPSLQAPSSRAPSSRPPSSRTPSVAPSIRSDYVSSTVSAARLQADEGYAESVISCAPSEVRSSARSCRPSAVPPSEVYTSSVCGRAPSIAASTRSSVKSSRNERDVSVAPTARSRAREEDYEPRTQSQSTSKRASSIKPDRSERGGSIASKARRYIEVDDYESSGEREPTSRRASSKASSSKSSRKASRDDRGRSTTSRTKGPCNELVKVKVTYEEHEDNRTKSRARSGRSESASTRRSSSCSSTETIRALRPGKDNALVAYRDNALHTAEASKDYGRRKSSRRKKSSAMSVVSVSTTAGLPVMRPDPSDSEAEQASGKKGQRSHHNRQQQQPYHPQPYTQPYPPQYAQPYPGQQQYPQQQPHTAPGAYGYPNEYPQYTHYQYPNQQYPNPRYTHPPPTAQSYFPTADASYPSPYVKPTPQYGTGYEKLGEELEQGRRSGRLPKARDRRHEKVGRPRRTTRLEGKYEEPPEVYESQYDDGEFPDRWFDN